MNTLRNLGKRTSGPCATELYTANLPCWRGSLILPISKIHRCPNLTCVETVATIGWPNSCPTRDDMLTLRSGIDLNDKTPESAQCSHRSQNHALSGH